MVITIIVLLILAAISIATLTGENGILTKADAAKEESEIARLKEEAELVKQEALINAYSDKNRNGKLEKDELLAKLNEYFEGSTLEEDYIITKDNKYYIMVDEELNITVVKNPNNSESQINPDEIVSTGMIFWGLPRMYVEKGNGDVYLMESDFDWSYKLKLVNEGDAELVTSNGIKKAGEYHFIDNEGKLYGGTTNITDEEGSGLNGVNLIDFIDGYNQFIAISDDGMIYEKQLDYYECISDTPDCDISGVEFVDIKIEGNFIIALDKNGKVYTWGYNGRGELGDGTTTNSNVPICLNDIDTPLKGLKVKAVNYKTYPSHENHGVITHITTNNEIYYLFFMYPTPI